MAKLVNRHTLELEICELFNLKGVKKLDIHFEVGEVSSVTAEFFPELDEVEQLKPILKKFKLIPIEDDHGESSGA